MAHDRRKADHIRINLEEEVQFPRVTTGFERYRLQHQALPELDLRAVSTGVELFGKSLRLPLLISSMTGGTTAAAAINRNLAEGAQMRGIAMGLVRSVRASSSPKRPTPFGCVTWRRISCYSPISAQCSSTEAMAWITAGEQST